MENPLERPEKESGEEGELPQVKSYPQSKIPAEYNIPPYQKITTTDPNNMSKKGVTAKQYEHLKYARECKKLKQVGRENDRQITNSNLDFIYRRLTNIENQIRSVADPKQPVIDYRDGYIPNTSGKRARRGSDAEDDSVTTSEKSKKKKKAEESKKEYSFYNSFKEYATRGALVFTVGIVFSLAKHYMVNGRTKSTNDGDTIGDYYTGPDNQ